MERRQLRQDELSKLVNMFTSFINANNMKTILALFRSMCDIMTVQPSRLPAFYPIIKEHLSVSWRAQALFKKFDARASHKVYQRGEACPGGRVLIIGAGPCGLRAALECQLLGCKVVVIEKRDRMTRNNILHLWPFVIQDLKALGAKKFYGKFCSGSIDHISIWQLQTILLKVCLLLGVEFYENVSFEELVEPSVSETESVGWHARVTPPDHVVGEYEFDVLIGADGKRNTLRGFKRNDFRAKLAIAITANYINRQTEQEAAVPEISGVTSIYNPKFFKELQKDTCIDLENIVYYKGNTHYFVMTPKKNSLLEKGVLIRDYAETSLLLSKENVDRKRLMLYAKEAATYATEGQLPNLEFAVNHYGEPDVTLFDFTSMYAAENACRVLERLGRRLLCCLVGDSLLEPFWPTGTGCARGFLSALDAAWAVRAWGAAHPPHPIAIIQERESIYRLLAQTTPLNLQRDLGAYTLDPRTRYPNLNRALVAAARCAAFYHSDEPARADGRLRKKKYAQLSEEALVAWVERCTQSEPADDHDLKWAVSACTLAALVRHYRPDLLGEHSCDYSVYEVLHTAYDIQQLGNPKAVRRDEVSDMRLRGYLRAVYRAFKGEIPRKRQELDSASLLDLSENGNYSEEQSRQSRPDSARRHRKRKQKTSQVSSFPLTPEYQPVLRNVGKLDLGDYTVGQPCKLNRDERYVGKLDVDNGWIASRTDREKTPPAVGKLPKRQLISKSYEKPKRTVGKLKVSQDLANSILPQLRADALSKRRVAREIAKRNFEKSLRLLATSPSWVPTGAVDLENDYGLQQYRAAAPDFGERVKKLEKKLMHFEEGRAVGGGSRSGNGATVARLAAELASGGKRTPPPRAGKPSDLLRSVGRIEKGDWNVRSIERKMEENRMGRPAPRQAERVPKWGKEKFLETQQRHQAWAEGAPSDEPLGELEQTVKHIDQLRRDSGRPALGTNKVAKLAEEFSKQKQPEPSTSIPLVVPAKPWSAGETGSACAACKTRVFAAEGVRADGLNLHKACFRCATCRAPLRPGMFAVMGDTLHCLNHQAQTISNANLYANEMSDSARWWEPPSERIAVAVSDGRGAELDEDEWAGRNLLTSENSCADGPCSDESSDEYTEAPSSAEASESAGREADSPRVLYAALGDLYLSDSYDERDDDDYDDDDTASESDADSRQLAARAARRMEHPRVAAAVVDDSTEVDSDAYSETSSGTGVSTDTEFGTEDKTPVSPPPKVIPSIVITTPTPKKYIVRAPDIPNDKPLRLVVTIERKNTTGPEKEKPTQGDKTVEIYPVVNPEVKPKEEVKTATPPRFQLMRAYTALPLSRTQSASGIATKRALELKRRYLLGEPVPTSINKSDSTSCLSTQIEQFNNNISQFQALLNPAPPTPVNSKSTTNVQSSNLSFSTMFNAHLKELRKQTPQAGIERDSLSDTSSDSPAQVNALVVPRLEVHDPASELIDMDSLNIDYKEFEKDDNENRVEDDEKKIEDDEKNTEVDEKNEDIADSKVESPPESPPPVPPPPVSPTPPEIPERPNLNATVPDIAVITNCKAMSVPKTIKPLSKRIKSQSLVTSKSAPDLTASAQRKKNIIATITDFFSQRVGTGSQKKGAGGSDAQRRSRSPDRHTKCRRKVRPLTPFPKSKKPQQESPRPKR